MTKICLLHVFFFTFEYCIFTALSLYVLFFVLASVNFFHWVVHFFSVKCFCCWCFFGQCLLLVFDTAKIKLKSSKFWNFFKILKCLKIKKKMKYHNIIFSINIWYHYHCYLQSLLIFCSILIIYSEILLNSLPQCSQTMMVSFDYIVVNQYYYRNINDYHFCDHDSSQYHSTIQCNVKDPRVITIFGSWLSAVNAVSVSINIAIIVCEIMIVKSV